MERLDQFIRLKTAGEGTYGIVYKAKNKITGKFVALKKIKLERGKGDYEGVPSTAIREICLLKGLRHSNIVDLLDVICVRSDLYLVFEYLEIDLKKYFDSIKKNMSEALIKSYMKQLIEGVHYLHTRRILHRDLKPQNLLLDNEGHIKLADFGLSRTFSLPTRTYTHEVVTLWYRAPELLLGTRVYSVGIDMWSLGCIMAEMIRRDILFPGESEIDQLFKIFTILGTPSEESWTGISRLPNYQPNFPKWQIQPVSKYMKKDVLSLEAKDFLDKILEHEPEKRLTADRALKHKFLKNAKLTAPDLECFSDK